MAKEIAPAGGTGLILLTPQTYEQIRRELALGHIELDPADFVVTPRDGHRIAKLRSTAEFPEAGGGGTTSLCAFGRVTDGETSGTKVLTPGNIIAGGDTVSKGGEFGPELTPEDGHFVWAEVEIEAEVEDGVLTSAYTATGHTISSGATEPDDHEWTPDDETGKAYRVLGYWEETSEDVFVFHGYECGSVSFDFCAKNTVRGYAKSWRG